MIIVNGTIEEMFIHEGGELDYETGNPMPAVRGFKKPIPCQYEATTYNRLHKTQGEPNISQHYWILIEMVDYTKPIEKLRLKDSMGNEIGEFDVIQCIPYPAVCQMKILV